jgi:hypothetical protein
MCGLSCVAKHYGSVVCLVLSYAGQSYDGMVCVVYPSTMVCVVCLVLSYVWLYGMCGLSCVAKHYGSVVCLVLSYAGPYYDGMVCVALSYVAQACNPMVCLVYPASPSTMDLWYVRSCPMSSRPMILIYVWLYPTSSRPMILIYVWLYPTSPRPAILRYARSYPMPPPAGAGFYVFRPITSDVGLSASVWSTQDHTRPPFGGVAPRRAEVPTGGTHTPVFDSTVR